MWILLESGSNSVTRKTAAEQIGEIQKLHPHELHNLLRKVNAPYLSVIMYFVMSTRYREIRPNRAGVKLYI